MPIMPDPEAKPIFTQPVRQIVMMVVVLILVAIGTYVAFPRVAPVFLANPALNGFIALVFIIGVLACFWQEWQLITSVSWIESFVAGRPGHRFSKAPRLLAPLAQLLRSREKRAMQISPTSARSILDSVASRIDEARDITRYIVSLLIFLGLLGTFYGLAITVPAIVETIRALAPAEGEDGMAVFGRLMNGLETQLGGMGVAFASSLLGLAGSLVVGLLELFASHGQNRFYRELEEWLSSITRLGYTTGDGDAAGDQGLSAAMIEHMAEQVDRLQQVFLASDEARRRLDGHMAELAAQMGRVADRLDRDNDIALALQRVADGQSRLTSALEAGAEGSGRLDSESRQRLRSIDVQMMRLIEETSVGRQEATAELRRELRQLGRSVARPRGLDPAGQG